MFKTIRDFVPAPLVMMMCDDACGALMTMPLQVTDPIDPVAESTQQAAFVQAAAQQGWQITLERQRCPQHVAQMRGERSMIVLAAANALRN